MILHVGVKSTKKAKKKHEYKLFFGVCYVCFVDTFSIPVNSCGKDHVNEQAGAQARWKKAYEMRAFKLGLLFGLVVQKHEYNRNQTDHT